jgi:catechol 2,3-dioxygenase-like lactoylglutathione lyase family enzyme
MEAKYTHTNLIARDWRRLAAFYENVFGCVPVAPERNLTDESISRGTGVRGARIQGVHLRLPGFGREGPTLEVFQYAEVADAPMTVANRVGFGHIAFAVEDVVAARDAVLAAGGSAVGTVEAVVIPGSGRFTWTYMRDPEGNIVELQRYEPETATTWTPLIKT